MRTKLKITLNVLNQLDSDRMTLVMYHPVTMELVLKQPGSNIVRLNHLIGYLKPIKHTCVLYPEDLKHIKEVLQYVTEGEFPIMVSPIRNGYRIWQMGDIAYTSRPRILDDIKFYSLSNRFLIFIEKLKSEELRFLFNTTDLRLGRKK